VSRELEALLWGGRKSIRIEDPNISKQILLGLVDSTSALERVER